MVQLKDLKQNWWLRDFLRLMEWIIKRYLPCHRMNTIRILLSYAANLDWNLLQFGVKNAFLNGDLQEEVYMEIPPKQSQGKICIRKESLYELKQSPRA